MAIDILFLIMATFGFYFGYTFGLMRLALGLFSFLFAALAAMSFTPMTSGIIQETFGIDSVFLPFAAFGITLLIVLMLARIVTKLVEETLTNERFDVLSRFIGGLLMALWFTLLYSVLVIFFGQAGVLKMVFNDEAIVRPSDGTVQLSIPPKTLGTGTPDTLALFVSNDPDNLYKFRKQDQKSEASITINFGFMPVGNSNHQPYVNNKGRSWNILAMDSVVVRGTRQLELSRGGDLICFCDSAFVIHPQSDSALLFRCTQDVLVGRSATSKFYPYIAVVPQRGSQLMNGLRPLINNFIEYMDVALDRVERKPPAPATVDSYDGDEIRPTVEPNIEEDLPTVVPQEMDSLGYPVDTNALPMEAPDSAAVPLPDVDPATVPTTDYEG